MSVKLKILLMASLLIPSDVRGKETNLPQQTFSKCVSLSLANSGFKVKEEVKQEQPKQQEYIREFNALITFYSNGYEETGKTSRSKDYGITARGNRARVKHSIAMDKSIPFGTIIEIDQLGTFVVDDRGGAVHGNHIDVFVSTATEARKLGVKHLKARIIKWGDGKRVGQ